MPISLRNALCDPEKHIRSYGVCGIVLAIVWPAVWAMLVVSQPISHSMAWWVHLTAIPVAFGISWIIVQSSWSMNADVQRQANRSFLRRYWQIAPWAVGAVAVYGLCL